MKKKINIIICISFLIIFFTVFLVWNIEKENKVLKENNYSDINNNNNQIAIMVETGIGTGTYSERIDNSWPDLNNYTFNNTKSGCENGSILSFNYETGKLNIKTKNNDKCYIFFDAGLTEFNHAILVKNGGIAAIEAKGIPDFSKTPTTNEGLYKVDDGYGKSYYFRGAVDNNWVKFAGFYWRIIRINGDGSVRLIYTGTVAPTSTQSVVMTGSDTQIGTSRYNSTSGISLLSYMYSDNNHGNLNSSSIKEYVDSWFINNLYDDYKSYLADNGFCTDRIPSTKSTTSNGMMGSSTGSTYFGSAIRINTKSMTLKCPLTSDFLTMNKMYKNEYIGSGTLLYPVGLILAEEVYMASIGTSAYLYTNNEYFTLSPKGISSGRYSVYSVTNSGTLSAEELNPSPNSLGVRPVLSIKGTSRIRGSGTWDDPYIVQ